ncbi:hypothetical protein [Streptomonospora wellingtoniae]|uniref:Uncharacterized protein n=1 Tax=Streptomonospora wellingtoniae TaxID=3075544 RepID=A0ABU2KN34_9ACTN|nr:hypothetical protein [Streptomonospora sp. DSM 45055]MDT0300681.1 hypothetical protein [Streptomonospora sp. DSM 45055]
MPDITLAPARTAARVHRRTGTLAPMHPPVPAPAPVPPPREPADIADTPPTRRPCTDCAHPLCRTRRAGRQDRIYGRTPEFAREHRTAAALRARCRSAVVWFGEATQSYWAATPGGLIEAPDADTLLLTLSAGAARPRRPSVRSAPPELSR